jgi:hypothetical protein
MRFSSLEDTIIPDNQGLIMLGLALLRTGNQRTHLWHHQTAMGLQPHQFNWIGKSKWGA